MTPHAPAPKHERDVLVFEGVVIRCHRGDVFLVECQVGDSRRIVTARRAGRLNHRSIKVIAGDRVRVEVGVYDLTKGRIVYRL